MSLENMELWDAMKDVKYSRTIEDLRKVIRESSEDLNAAWKKSLALIANVAHAEAGTLWIYDRYGDGFIHPRAAYGGSELFDIRLKPGEGVAGGVIKTGEGTVIADCQKDPRWAGRVDASTGFRTLSMVCVPLISKGDTFGSVQLINKTDGTMFDDKDFEFAQHLAFALAQQFENEGLLQKYHETQRTGDRVSFTQLFGTDTVEEQAEILKGLDEFKCRSYSEQRRMLAAFVEIWSILHKEQTSHGTGRIRSSAIRRRE